MTPVSPAALDPATDVELGWFVYALVDADADLPDDLEGLDGEPVEAVVHGRVAAVASQYRVDRPTGRAADLLAFHEVVDRLAQSVPAVVPVRFGSVLPARESIVDDLLAPDEPWFADLVDQVRGHVQLVVQALYDQEAVLREVVESEPEIAWLRSRTRDLPEDAATGERVRLGELVAAAVDYRRELDSAALLHEVVPLVEDYRLRPVSGLERVLDVALLVDPSRREELETRLERLAEEVHGRMRLRLVGPTAAYDFAEGP
ncbi:GvpL/GvpF family gas vesicle protein [Nocardioides sp. GXQ0305]|uniref:GvpL/GvpF family gas vesicle protein n=1 Tax=Nocardioides sp. GXQ0305 TaxID=3423912 RepID=UPI003D7E9A26